jgi:hypothetical protein
MGYRTVAASGTCDIQASAGNLRQSYCTVSGSGIDHGKSNFKARSPLKSRNKNQLTEKLVGL